eukprot:2350157-Prymnesium_polylepis.1
MRRIAPDAVHPRGPAHACVRRQASPRRRAAPRLAEPVVSGRNGGEHLTRGADEPRHVYAFYMLLYILEERGFLDTSKMP